MKVHDIIAESNALDEGFGTWLAKKIPGVLGRDTAREVAKELATKSVAEAILKAKIAGRDLSSPEAYKIVSDVLGKDSPRLADKGFMQEVFNEADAIANKQLKGMGAGRKGSANPKELAAAGAESASGWGPALIKTGLFGAAAADTIARYTEQYDAAMSELKAGQIDYAEFVNRDKLNKQRLIFGLAADIYVPMQTGPFIAWWAGLAGKIPGIGRPFRALSAKVKDTKVFTWALGTLFMHYPLANGGYGWIESLFPDVQGKKDGTLLLAWLVYFMTRKNQQGQWGLGWGLGGDLLQEFDAWFTDIGNIAVEWTNANAGIDLKKWETDPQRAARMIAGAQPTTQQRKPQPRMDQTDDTADQEVGTPARDQRQTSTPVKPIQRQTTPQQPAAPGQGTTLDWNTMKK